MLDAGQEALLFFEGKTRADLNMNRMLVLSLVKDIEIIGEAASKVSRETCESLIQIPWLQIVGMRNRLIHAYFDVDLDILWKTILEDVPQLVSSLNEIIQTEAKQ